MKFFKRTYIISLILLIYSSSLSAENNRVIKRIKDLTHESGKTGLYKALIIGINDYKDPKIPNLTTAVNDAKEMGKVLEKKYGFRVTLLLNQDASLQGLYKALRTLSTTAGLNDSILIYYAGHGALDNEYDDGWWIPSDAEAGNPLTYLNNTQVQKAMKATKARHALLISDSCYSGTLFGQTLRRLPLDISEKYYLNLYNEKSRWGITSGSREPVSDAGTNGNSIFAYQLLKALRKNEKPYLSTQELYTNIAPIIANNSEQTPLCRPIRMTGDQGGEFIFIIADRTDTDDAAPQTKISKPDKDGKLTIKANVQNAVVWFNGTKFNKVPITFSISKAGKYTIKVIADGYITYETSKFINLGENNIITADLIKKHNKDENNTDSLNSTAITGTKNKKIQLISKTNNKSHPKNNIIKKKNSIKKREYICKKYGVYNRKSWRKNFLKQTDFGTWHVFVASLEPRKTETDAIRKREEFRRKFPNLDFNIMPTISPKNDNSRYAIVLAEGIRNSKIAQEIAKFASLCGITPDAYAYQQTR